MIFYFFSWLYIISIGITQAINFVGVTGATADTNQPALGRQLMNYPYEETGNRIFMLRKERGLTRERLAEMADISVQFLADIEKGRKT